MRTFKQYCEARLAETAYGSRPALLLNFKAPNGLFYSWKRPITSLGSPDYVDEEGTFTGSVEVPVRESVVKAAGEAGQDLKTYIQKIGVDAEPSEMFDEPDRVVDIQNAEFMKLPSVIDTVPDSLYESLKESFWIPIKSGDFQILN